MLIISTTIAGNHESLIGDALRSVVDWVDICLVVDTGSTDGSLRVAREIAGEKYRGCSHPWTDCSSARNFALEAARELGGDWAVTLDTDERITAACDVRAELELAQESLLYVSDAGGSYVKERFFRLPAVGRWDGPVHEAFSPPDSARTLEGLSFIELPKSADDYQKRFRRDAEALRRHVEAHPTEPRWRYYLGESHRNLGEHALAVAAYDACAALRGWDEESAWACFRAAESLCALGCHAEALDRLAVGMARHAGIAELAWLAGFVCYQLGRDAQAVYWAQLAITHGLFRGDGASIPRIGFRDPAGLWEGPYDVLRWAEKRRGNESAARDAGLLWAQAKRARLALTGN